MKLLGSLLLPVLLLGSSFVHATTVTQVALGLIDELKRPFKQEQVFEPSNLLVKGKPFPSLLDVTLEELTVGLESGLFTSVDLVQVRYYLFYLHQLPRGIEQRKSFYETNDSANTSYEGS